MNKKKPVFFNDAITIALEKIKAVDLTPCNEIVIVRDLRGRIKILLPKKLTKSSEHEKLSTELSNALGYYGDSPDRMVMIAGDMVQGEEIFNTPDRRCLDKKDITIYLLDRQIVGQDWMRETLVRTTQNPRVTFYGIKGGVGRSTALIVWAWRLAKRGKKVLLFDLDLESPGVSSTLLPEENMPDYGIVDWFIEDGVGQADLVENNMIVTSPLAKNLSGDIRIVPSYGRETGDYLPKLARCYAGSGGPKPLSWGERIQKLVETSETIETPDIVIFDSRAGIHDIAATLVTRMEALTFLFAIESPQTWTAYSFLFNHWKTHPDIKSFRERLQMVAGMIPETGRDEYLKRFQEKSWDIFRDNMYDEIEAETTDAFSYDVTDETAPHYPLPVFWNRALQEFSPGRNGTEIDEQISEAALGKFMSEAETLVFRTDI